MTNPIRQDQGPFNLFSIFSETTQNRAHIAALVVIGSVTCFIVGSAYLEGRVSPADLSILNDLLGLIPF